VKKPFLLMACLLVIASSSLAQGSANGKIAFASNRDGNNNFEIYVMNADGSAQTRLTDHPAWDVSPSLSPDGSRIAFSSRRDGNYEIYVMNADGSGLTRLTNDPAADFQPVWSPDGRKIAFSSDRYVSFGIRSIGIFIMNADGSDVTMPIVPAGDSHPTWSPDGRKIAFASIRGDDIFYFTRIWVMNVDGSALTQLTVDPAGSPRWSPDGSKILFLGNGISVMNADGSNQRSLIAGPATQPAWSPDGRQIVFADRDPDFDEPSPYLYNYDIYTMNADGSAVRRLTTHPFYDYEPAWSR
jgi:Tol biopolymer transport system component